MYVCVHARAFKRPEADTSLMLWTADEEYVLSPALQDTVMKSMFTLNNAVDAEYTAWGVGFFVKANVAVTANHVITKLKKLDTSLTTKVSVCFYDGLQQHTVRGQMEVVFQDHKLDVAILKAIDDVGACHPHVCC